MSALKNGYRVRSSRPSSAMFPQQLHILNLNCEVIDR